MLMRRERQQRSVAQLSSGVHLLEQQCLGGRLPRKQQMIGWAVENELEDLLVDGEGGVHRVHHAVFRRPVSGVPPRERGCVARELIVLRECHLWPRERLDLKPGQGLGLAEPEAGPEAGSCL